MRARCARAAQILKLVYGSRAGLRRRVSPEGVEGKPPRPVRAAGCPPLKRNLPRRHRSFRLALIRGAQVEADQFRLALILVAEAVQEAGRFRIAMLPFGDSPPRPEPQSKLRLALLLLLRERRRQEFQRELVLLALGLRLALLPQVKSLLGMRPRRYLLPAIPTGCRMKTS